MSVANQKIIKLAPRAKRDRDHLYAMVNLDALKEAMKVLDGSSIKLWMYCNKNIDGYQFNLSRVDCEKWGLKKDAYYRAVKELTDKGFLVPICVGSNIFLFHERAVAVTERPKNFSESELESTANPKKVSEKPERNNTNNTENTNNNTLDDDNADGVIVDCGEAAIPKEESYSERMTKWFGTFKNEKVCEDPNAIYTRHGL